MELYDVICSGENEPTWIGFLIDERVIVMAEYLFKLFEDIIVDNCIKLFDGIVTGQRLERFVEQVIVEDEDMLNEADGNTICKVVYRLI